MTENEIGSIIVDTAVYLHKKLGSGLLESVYDAVLTRLLSKRGLFVQRQVSIPIEFEDEHFDEGFRVEKITSAHKKQLLTYLKLTNTKLGYILNFGTALIKDGINRIVNGLSD